jgi:hypothetical protein
MNLTSAICRHQPTVPEFEQGESEFFLDPPQLLRHGRLAHAESGRRQINPTVYDDSP